MDVVVAERSCPSNIDIDEKTKVALMRRARLDAGEEMCNAPWNKKALCVTNLFTIDPRVKLAPIVRAEIAKKRIQCLDNRRDPIFNTPEKSLLNHMLTVEHMINIILNGQAFLCLPGDSNQVRLNITAQLTLDYSDGITRPGSLDRSGWGTLSFLINSRNNQATCIHYFTQRLHPGDVAFSEHGCRFKTYFILPIHITAFLDGSGKLFFSFNSEEYDAISKKLFLMKEAALREYDLARKKATGQLGSGDINWD